MSGRRGDSEDGRRERRSKGGLCIAVEVVRIRGREGSGREKKVSGDAGKIQGSEREWLGKTRSPETRYGRGINVRQGMGGRKGHVSP